MTRLEPAFEDEINQDTPFDRLLRAEIGRYTGGLSPVALALAFADWSMHLGMSPNRQVELMRKGVRKSLRLAAYLGRCAKRVVRPEQAFDLGGRNGHDHPPRVNLAHRGCGCPAIAVPCQRRHLARLAYLQPRSQGAHQRTHAGCTNEMGFIRTVLPVRGPCPLQPCGKVITGGTDILRAMIKADLARGQGGAPCGNAPTYPAPLVQHQNRLPRSGKSLRTGDPCHACPDDQHIWPRRIVLHIHPLPEKLACGAELTHRGPLSNT